MSSLEFDILPDRVPDPAPDQAHLETSRPRRSFVGSIRSKTSRLFGRNTPNPKNADIAETVEADNTNTADITSTADLTGTVDIISIADSISQPVQASSAKTKRSWFNSVGTRFHRHGRRTILLSSDSEQCVHVELEDATGVADQPSALEIPRSPSPISRRLFGTRRHLRLQSLPSKLRRSTSMFRRSSSSLSDKGKENLMSPAIRAEGSALITAANTGSWSSFRSGVQRAVREMVDGSFRFSDDRTAGNTPPTRPHLPRVPLRTLWTIMSADSDGNEIPRPPSPGGSSTKQYHFAEWSSPECWSPAIQQDKNNYILVSPSPHNDTHTPNNTSETATAEAVADSEDKLTGTKENDATPIATTAPRSRACSASSSGSDASSAFVSEPRSVVYHSPASEAPSRGGSFRSWRAESGSGGSRGPLLGSGSGSVAGGGGDGGGGVSGSSGGAASGGKVRGRRGRGFLLDDVQSLLADIQAPVGDDEGHTHGRSQGLASPVGEESSSSPVEEENQTGVLQEVGNAGAGRAGEGVGWEMEKDGGGCGCGGEEEMVMREGVRPRVVSYPAAAV